VANGQAGRATIRVAGVDGGASDSQSPFRGRAPWLPSFFAVTVPQESKSTTPLVRGASQFADSRESDFRKAAPVDTLEAIRMGQALKQSITDPWAPLWAGIAVVALLIAWGWRGAKGRAGVDDAPQLSGA
jgi:hypothetical protein